MATSSSNAGSHPSARQVDPHACVHLRAHTCKSPVSGKCTYLNMLKLHKTTVQSKIQQ